MNNNTLTIGILTTVASLMVSSQGLCQELEIEGDSRINGKLEIDEPVNSNHAATKFYVDQMKEMIYNELLEAGLNGIVKDIDGNLYKTVKIGNQVWMVDNLKTSRFNDGSQIPETPDSAQWASTHSPAYCWYNDDNDSIGGIYGALYNHFAVSIYNKNVCPTDWRIPTDSDWDVLEDYLGASGLSGGKLKEIGTRHWQPPNDGATDEVGFTALPGGWRDHVGNYMKLGTASYYYSSTSNGSFGVSRLMEYDSQVLAKSFSSKKHGHSVRCIRN